MMEDATTYVRMEEERDQLRLKMDETARKCPTWFCSLLLRLKQAKCFFAGEHKAALDRVRELEDMLKSQREDAERKARQVKESENLQAARLRAIADVIEGACYRRFLHMLTLCDLLLTEWLYAY